MSTLVENPDSAEPMTRAPTPGHVAGCAWFLTLTLLYALALPSLFHALTGAEAPFIAWAALLSRVGAVTFLAIQAWLMMARPPAVARTPGPVAPVIAIAGTFGVWLVGFLPTATLAPYLAMLAAAMTLLGSVLIIFCILHLGRSFSIAPQARNLVTGGPYALVRHPLYAAEEIALIGVAMHVVWYAAAPFLIFHLALQLRRMAYEEQLLRGVFPRYADYAHRTARLIPGLW